jgi:glycosyltransferase involved in cell wall biosynthesis
MKILIGGPYAYKNQKISGGVEAVLNNLKHGINLYESDINLKIVSGSDKVRSKIEIDNDITYIQHPKLKIGSVFLSSYPYRIKKFLKKSNFDVLNDHSIDFSYYELKRLDKLILTLHGIPWEEKKYLSKYKQPFWHILYVKRLEKILKNLRYFVSINPYSKEVVEKKTSAMIYDISNPIPDEIFELKNQSQENRILFIGLISERKNLFTLVKSINIIRKRNKNFKLIVAGKIGEQAYFNRILEYVNRNNLNPFFEYLGKITEEQKLEEFSKMSYLILPSYQETAPIVISEAFATGKPVIASNLCGIPYMIDDGKNGLLINPSDEIDISDKIQYLMENPGVITSMGINGKTYALKNHSLKVVAKKYRVAYEEIISNL